MRAHWHRRLGSAHRSRGLTLLEVLVSIAIVALIGTLIYGAFNGMSRSRDTMAQVNDRHQQGRAAVGRIARELSAAFISNHMAYAPKNVPIPVSAFIGSDSRPADRIDFTSFSHRRLRLNAHESDQNELSYFSSNDPETGKLDLVRREARYIDNDPTRGGIVQVLAQDIDSFDVRYLDPITNEWQDNWDSTQPAAQFGRLPSVVWVKLSLRGGANEATATFETKVTIPIQLPLSFALK